MTTEIRYTTLVYNKSIKTDSLNRKKIFSESDAKAESGWDIYVHVHLKRSSAGTYSVQYCKKLKTQFKMKRMFMAIIFQLVRRMAKE